MKKYKTKQEEFWAGNFGDEYINRNKSSNLLASNIHLFSKILEKTSSIDSILEFGANIGLNLVALKQILPNIDIAGIEINKTAVNELQKVVGEGKTYNESILKFTVDYQRKFVFTKGVLIHINIDELDKVYEKLYSTSKKYICIIEYYNPNPVNINYREHEGFLHKRDFAGEMLNKYSDLKLVDYGFIYHRDNNFPLDDLTWFLLKK